MFIKPLLSENYTGEGASEMVQTIKNLPAMQETWVHSLGWEDPLEKRMATHSNFLPGEFCGQRSLADYSARGCKGVGQDWVTFTFTVAEKLFICLSLRSHSFLFSQSVPQTFFKNSELSIYVSLKLLFSALVLFTCFCTYILFTCCCTYVNG